MGRDPGLASKYKPQVPAGAKPGSLDGAVAEVERALADAKLKDEPRQTLMAFQIELARANGDVKRAQSIGTKMSRDANASPARGPSEPGEGGGGRAAGGATGGAAQAASAGANPALALQMAFLALDQKQYEQALKEIDGAAVAITDPEQQVDALYAIAEARAGLAKDDPPALKDAALAYMRVVARAKSTRVTSARVADALLKTAALQERLNAPQEALLLYQQVAEEYKGTDAAARATQAADRLGKAGKTNAAPAASASGT
jgi:TolA-binding protein